MTRRVAPRLLAGLLAMLAAASTFGGTRAGAAAGGGWTLAPAAGSGPGFDLTLAAGQAVTERVVLSNDTSQPISFLVYGADASNAAKGGAFALTLPGAPTRGVGRWTVPAVSQITVPPFEAATIPFRLTVPSGTAPGDYGGGVVAVDTSAGHDVTTGRAQVHVLNGVGVRIALRVPGAVHAALALRRVRAEVSTGPLVGIGGVGQATISFTVANPGTATLDVTARVSVTDGFGRTVMRFPPQMIPLLLPGNAVTVAEPVWHHLPVGGAEHVHVVVSAGSLRATGQASFWLVPWVLLGVVAAVLLGAGMAAFRCQRRRRRRVTPPSPPPARSTAAHPPTRETPHPRT